MGVTLPWLWPATSIVSAHWSLREVTAPTSEPVTLAQLKVHLRIEASETYFDTDLTAKIIAARQQFEKETAKFVAVAGVYEFTIDGPASGDLFVLPHGGPIASVTSLTVYDTDSVGTVVDTGSYQLDSASVPPRLIIDTAAEDPAFEVELRDYRGIVLRVVGGAAASPAWATHAVKLLVEYWWTPEPDDSVKRAYDSIVNTNCVVSVA